MKRRRGWPRPPEQVPLPLGEEGGNGVTVKNSGVERRGISRSERSVPGKVPRGREKDQTSFEAGSGCACLPLAQKVCPELPFAGMGVGSGGSARSDLRRRESVTKSSA